MRFFLQAARPASLVERVMGRVEMKWTFTRDPSVLSHQYVEYSGNVMHTQVCLLDVPPSP